MTPVSFIERVTSVAQLYDLRSGASQWLAAADADDDTIEVVALVLSEACTNALTHGHADAVEVEVTIDDVDDGDAAVVTVWTRHDDHDPTLLGLPTAMPAAAATRGRGLALVDLLVDGMTLRIDPPHVVRKCWLRTCGESSST